MWHFNNYNQPIRKGGYMFMRSLGYIVRIGRFCSIGTISWHKLNRTYKADIIEMVQSKFMYLVVKGFHKCALKHVAKHFKQYKHGLKRDHFKPKEKTKEDMYEIVPKGQSRDGWMLLVDYWCSEQHDNEARSKFQERLLNSSPSKTQVEIKNEVFDKLMHEEDNPKRPIGFGFNVPEESSGDNLSNELRHTGPSTSTSQVSYLDDVGLFKTFNDWTLAIICES
ncbi:hypothetical protein Cgig2_009109 [Carnegiea gigantea]|uniref:Transposase n=1 Tax=Carnegiea gigantea TaxID=171969 RepID=A0A9Q1GXJ2_9CARY|nr:hypothetical protein Cgig2_009109 [Carnegiea gigantea]